MECLSGTEKDFQKPKTEKVHPCQSCGACCSYFRVSFYWREAEKSDVDNPVPQNFWEEGPGSFRVMKGTAPKHNPKCTALQGTIGDFVACSIYSNRPTPCRNFKASFEDGTHHERCDQARAKHGLRPLGREDW